MIKLILFVKKNIKAITIIVITLVVFLTVRGWFTTPNTRKELKDQEIKEVIVDLKKSEVQINDVKKKLPPEARVVIRDTPRAKLAEKILYSTITPKGANKTVRIKRMGFVLTPKVGIATDLYETYVFGGVRIFWLSFYGIDVGGINRCLYVGLDRRLGDIHYKLKNISLGVAITTKQEFYFTAGILF